MRAIVAVAQNLVIGDGYDIPWHYPDDLKRFKEKTVGHPVIMGRKTFESLGRPLPGRTNIVLTRDVNYPKPTGVLIFNSKEDAMNYLQRHNQLENAWVIGGLEIYNLFFDDIHYFDVTEIPETPEGNVFFPVERVVESGDFQHIQSTAYPDRTTVHTFRRTH